jgi:hypothetical protein
LQEVQKYRGPRQGNDGQVLGPHRLRSKTPVDPGLDPPWSEQRNVARSPSAGFFEAFIQPAMLLFPVVWTYFDWITGVQTLKSECFKFIFRRLISVYKTLHVGSDGEAFGFSSLPKPRFKPWVNGDGHDIP